MPKSHCTLCAGVAATDEWRSWFAAVARPRLAKEFKRSAQAIRNWVRHADRDAGRRQDGLKSTVREEFARLRRENEQPRQLLTTLWP